MSTLDDLEDIALDTQMERGTRTCPECGVQFPAFKRQVTCSKKCQRKRILAYKKRFRQTESFKQKRRLYVRKHQEVR